MRSKVEYAIIGIIFRMINWSRAFIAYELLHLQSIAIFYITISKHTFFHNLTNHITNMQFTKFKFYELIPKDQKLEKMDLGFHKLIAPFIIHIHICNVNLNDGEKERKSWSY